uniref:uncharacterized protein isoform X2 n=1 Tax=Myxine glutinosa TaxID=7769 RepID=UPI00358E8660
MATCPGQTSRSRRGERVVQLAPACLAIVLGRESEPEGERVAPAAQTREPWPSGYQLFADFKAANASRFWDARVSAGVRAARLAGWLHGGALLVRGERAQLDALRDAWGRRALRPPSGFTIRHVGDVRPILMVPAAQSHFIPLGDVLCAAIAQLAGRQQPVTQERLLQYLDQAFPGVPTPNQEVLHSTLGSLIKERKIYHTGEGYFIVTPQTYYVTSSLIRDDKKWVRSERDSPETCFPVLTPSNESNDCWQSPFGAHCLSCQCFHAEGNVSGEGKVDDKDGGIPMEVHNEKAHTKYTIEEKSKKVEKVNAKDLTANGVNGVRVESGRRKEKGVTSESKRRQLIGALPMLAEKNKKSDEKDSPASSGSGCKDKSHDLILSKAEREREGEKVSKVFGLRLFRRSSQRKEKIPRKEHATFSAQFPPIEWPVRDEESQENLPRHLEHQIIRRINPELTVQNLLRHTALLEHVTAQATSRDAGTSTVIPAMRSRGKTRATNRRLTSSGSRIRSRTHGSRRRARALSSKVSSADEAICHREETTEKPWTTSREYREQWIGPGRPHSDEDILVDEAGHVSGHGAEEIPSWLQSWQRTQNNGDIGKRLSRRKGCVCRNDEGGHVRKDHKAHHLKIRSKSVEPSKSKISMKHDFTTAGDKEVTSHGGHQNSQSNGLENTPNVTTAQCELTEKLMHGTFRTSNGINYQGFSRTQPIHHQRRSEMTRKLYHFEPAEKDSCSLANTEIGKKQKDKDCDCNIPDAMGCTADYFNNNESRETILCAPENPSTFNKHVRKEKQLGRNESSNEVQNFVTVNSFVCNPRGEANVHKKVHILKERCSGEVAKINEVALTHEAQRGLTCENEAFTDEDCQLYVQDIQEDSDGSSLCLNEEDGSADSPNSPLQVPGSYHCPPIHFLNKIDDSHTPCPSAIARDAGNSSQHQEKLMDRFKDGINGGFSNNLAVETKNFRDDQDIITHCVQDGSKQERSGVTRVRGKQLQLSTPLMRLEEDIVEGFAGEVEGSIFDCNPNTEAETFLEMANDDEISDILSPQQSQGTVSQGDFECRRDSTDQEGFNENPGLASPDPSVSSTMDSGLPPSRAENTDLHNFIISSRSSSPRNGKFLTPSASIKMNTVKMQCQTTTNISGSSRSQNATSDNSESQTRLDHTSKNTQDNTSQTRQQKVLRRMDNSVFIALKHEAPVNGMPLSKISGNEQPADADQWAQQSRPEQQKALATVRTRLARPLQEQQPSNSTSEPQNTELGWTSGLSGRQIQSSSHLVNMSRTDSGTVGSREMTGATFSLSPTINV